MSLSERIRDYRYAKGWGPDELATRAEVSRTAIYQIECGRTEAPRAATLRKIAQALEVSIDVLLSEARENSSSPSHVTNGAGSASPMEELVSLPKKIRRAPTAFEHELMQKFEEVLASPLGESISRIVAEAHNLIAIARTRGADS